MAAAPPSTTPSDNFPRWNDWVVYTADDGIFAYDPATRAVAAVLLSPLSDGSGARVDYRYPVALAGGTAYVVGLMSSDGAVGAGGPSSPSTSPSCSA